MPMPPPPDLKTLDIDELIRLAGGRDRPPVDRWTPTPCGDSTMRIARDGRWSHAGSPIERPAMVRLFSRLLRREPGGGHALVTPVEHLTIAVEDTAFLAVDLRVDGSGPDTTLTLALNTGELVVVDADHSIELRDDGTPVVAVVRQTHGPLLAALSRPVWMELAELALTNEPAGLWSRGHFQPLG